MFGGLCFRPLALADEGLGLTIEATSTSHTSEPVGYSDGSVEELESSAIDTDSDADSDDSGSVGDRGSSRGSSSSSDTPDEAAQMSYRGSSSSSDTPSNMKASG